MTGSQLSTKEQIASIWRLGGLSKRQLAKNVWSKILTGDLLTQSAAVAYSFFLAVFPMLLFMVALFGFFAGQSEGLQDGLFRYLAKIVPPSAYEVVAKTFAEIVVNSGGGKMTIGVILALWSATGGMTALISGLNAAYEVRETRPLHKVRFIAMALTVATSILVIAALSIVLISGSGLLAGSALHTASVLILKMLQWPVAMALLTIAYALVYYYGPDLKEQHWYWITPGSIVGVFLWLAISLGLRVYIHLFTSYSKTYGSLGAVIVLLLWFYVTGFAFLIGGEINAQIEHAAARRGHPEAKLAGNKAA